MCKNDQKDLENLAVQIEFQKITQVNLKMAHLIKDLTVGQAISACMMMVDHIIDSHIKDSEEKHGHWLHISTKALKRAKEALEEK